MQLFQIDSKQALAFYLNDIIKGCKAIALKNKGNSIEHTLNLMSWNVEQPNCFFLIAEHRKRCVGFLFALGVKNLDMSWCEIISLWTVPRLASHIKYESFDLLKKLCKDREIDNMITTITL